jgi:mRNA interferase RelE/StbE
MKINLQYAKHALYDLKTLDKKVSLQIVKKIKENSTLTDPLSRAKALAGPFSGLYRYRIGDYRVIFDITPTGAIAILTILRVKHRKEAYDNF